MAKTTKKIQIIKDAIKNLVQSSTQVSCDKCKYNTKEACGAKTLEIIIK